MYRFLSRHTSDYYMHVCLDFLSHHAIDASSGMKLMHGRTDVLKASHYDLTRADRTITALNRSLSTECAIGDSSTIFYIP